MDIWNFTKQRAKTLSKQAAQCANHALERTKCTISISECNDKINALYAQIGEQVYEANRCNKCVPDFQPYFAQISALHAQIAVLEQEKAKHNSKIGD